MAKIACNPIHRIAWKVCRGPGSVRVYYDSGVSKFVVLNTAQDNAVPPWYQFQCEFAVGPDPTLFQNMDVGVDMGTYTSAVNQNGDSYPLEPTLLGVSQAKKDYLEMANAVYTSNIYFLGIAPSFIHGNIDGTINNTSAVAMPAFPGKEFKDVVNVVLSGQQQGKLTKTLTDLLSWWEKEGLGSTPLPPPEDKKNGQDT